MSNFNIQLKYKPYTIEILSLEDSLYVPSPHSHVLSFEKYLEKYLIFIK